MAKLAGGVKYLLALVAAVAFVDVKEVGAEVEDLALRLAVAPSATSDGFAATTGRTQNMQSQIKRNTSIPSARLVQICCRPDILRFFFFDDLPEKLAPPQKRSQPSLGPSVYAKP